MADSEPTPDNKIQHACPGPGEEGPDEEGPSGNSHCVSLASLLVNSEAWGQRLAASLLLAASRLLAAT